MRKLYFLLFLVIAVQSPVQSSPEAGPEIKQAYSKACEAARLKFLPAMLSHRSSEFKAFGPDGREINTLGEEQKLQSLLDNALSVTESVEILSIQSVENGRFSCHVLDRLELKMVQPSSKTGQMLVILTESKDLWTKTPLGWRQTESRILKQEVEQPESSDV